MAPRPSTSLLVAIFEILLAGCSGPRGQSRALTDRGSAEFARGEYEAALADFAQAVKLDGENERARENVALVYKEERRWSEAARAFAELAARRPNEPWLAREVAAARAAQKNLDDEHAAEARANAAAAATELSEEERKFQRQFELALLRQLAGGTVGEGGGARLRSADSDGSAAFSGGTRGTIFANTSDRGGSLAQLVEPDGFGEISRAVSTVAERIRRAGRDREMELTRARNGRVLALPNEVDGALSAAEIRDVVQRRSDDVQRCFVSAIADGAPPERVVNIQLAIARRGTVLDAAPDRVETPVARCIAAVAPRWRFPSASSRTVAGVRIFLLSD